MVVEKDAQVEPAPDHYRIGEGLPSAARLLLSKLGVWQDFQHQGHLPCFAHESTWGSDRPQRKDLIRDPNGHGWHLDRLAFDRGLRVAAVDRGARLWCPAKLLGLKPRDGGWRLEVRSGAGRGGGQVKELDCHFLVDATGRVGRVASALGVERARDDELVGVHALFRQAAGEAEDRDATTRIEASPDGWWYSALLPGHRRVVAYFTDIQGTDIQGSESYRVSEGDGFDRLLARSQHLAPWLEARVYRRVGEPRSAPSHSARLERVVGSNWLAVGDAATAFDPLSSQGIYAALHHGIIAAEAIDAALDGRPAALDGYRHRVEKVYRAYLDHRNRYYAMEQRWSQRPFWRRRHLMARHP